ncbi:conserved protein of unknown function [uncultured Woeseiaceae bacterium]|uniref:Beta-lactamase-related domain-containing protein n=1 Tax=uncultured Woeseiaceae bacterium TaxID=1983305 RepID=A0A7D9D3E0_9GAMM|nr:conserved protein of unknown function [uncultured Woeseiaceae bacterium]
MAFNIKGETDASFAAVEEAFSRNFEDQGEVGAALCIYRGDRPVVDLWGGFKNATKTEPWQRDTMVCVYSVSKGVTATCVHMLVDRGLLDLDTPVAEYWPEFAQNGKETVTPRHILSHTAGIPAFEQPMSVEEYLDWDVAVTRLAEQAPRWEPGSCLGYQPGTFGHLAGELIRRVSGKSPGEFLGSEVVQPLGGDFHFGISQEHDHRIAELVPAPPEELANWGAADPDSMVGKALGNPDVGTPSVSNSTGWRRAELPGANGHGDARTVARIYAALANGGTLDGIQLLSSDSLDQAIEEQVAGIDCVMQLEGRMALGYALSGGFFRTTSSPRAFGYPGLGGHMAFADPDAQLGFAYVANQMRIPADFVDPRVGRILDAVDKCL